MTRGRRALSATIIAAVVATVSMFTWRLLDETPPTTTSHSDPAVGRVADVEAPPPDERPPAIVPVERSAFDPKLDRTRPPPPPGARVVRLRATYDDGTTFAHEFAEVGPVDGAKDWTAIPRRARIATLDYEGRGDFVVPTNEAFVVRVGPRFGSPWFISPPLTPADGEVVAIAPTAPTRVAFVDDDGRPAGVVEARAVHFGRMGMLERECVSDAEGHMTIPGIPPGADVIRIKVDIWGGATDEETKRPFAVTAAHDADIKETREFEMSAGATSVRATLRRLHRVTARLVDPEGEPVREGAETVRIRFFFENAAPSLERPVYRGTYGDVSALIPTDGFQFAADARITSVELSVRSATGVLRTTRQVPHRGDVDFGDVVWDGVGTPEPTDDRAPLKKSDGVVELETPLPDGTLVSLLVDATDRPDGNGAATDLGTQKLVGGRARWKSVPTGRPLTATFRYSAADRSLWRELGAVELSALEAHAPRIVRLAASVGIPVRGVVVDADGVPVAKARVEARGEARLYPDAKPTWITVAHVTDATGAFETEAAPSSVLLLRARGAFTQVLHRVDVDRSPVDVVMKLPTGRDVVVHVVDEAGEPVTGQVGVSLRPLGGDFDLEDAAAIGLKRTARGRYEGATVAGVAAQIRVIVVPFVYTGRIDAGEKESRVAIPAHGTLAVKFGTQVVRQDLEVEIEDVTPGRLSTLGMSAIGNHVEKVSAGPRGATRFKDKELPPGTYKVTLCGKGVEAASNDAAPAAVSKPQIVEVRSRERTEVTLGG